jgi:anti-sigma B factor antagonist
MKTSSRDQGNVRIVAVEGDVDLSSSAELRKVLFSALQGVSRLVINLGGIHYLDSSGIATLIEVLKESQKRNTEFALFAMSPAVHEVFRLTHVIKIFRVYETEEQAVGGAGA